MFHNIVPENNDAFVPFSYEFQTVPQQNQALVFANIHKQQFLLLYYRVTGNLPSLALVAQANDVKGWGSSAQQFSLTQHILLHWNLMDHPPYDEFMGRYE